MSKNDKKNRKYKIKDKKNNKEWYYIDKEELLSRYPDGGYLIIGEVSVNCLETEGNIKEIRLNEEESIPVKPSGTYSERKYYTKGYIPCEEKDKYIVVKKKKRTKMFMLLILALLLLLGGVGGCMFMKKKVDIDSNAGDYTAGLKRPSNISSSQILIPGYEKWTLKEGSNTINSALFNPEGNPCFFKYTIVEKQTGDVLYESKLVPPGKGITPIKLNKTFKKGNYTVVLKFESFDLEDTDIQYNGSDVEIQLNVVD
ncbi:hypothetical protein QTI98_10010 [Clostridium perfringens]|uniref:hypothetical protein n=1 Tax=Clostridium perfringens TaxID=1502 RepID=UPI0024BCA4B0|nr:hypothetical protein [Clostridium perfringens]MDM1009522.1 hypothetical protein [Clostridium perfringens]